MEKIVLNTDDEYLIKNIRWDELMGQHLVVPIRSHSGGIFVKRNNSHWIGSFSVRGSIVVVPPQFEAGLFVDLYLYAHGANILSWNKESMVTAGNYFGRDEDAFLIIMASVFVDQVKTVIGHNLAKKYIEKIERRQSIKGRPIWARDFGRHPSEGVTCRFYELSYKNKLNEAIMIGLEAASLILKGTSQFSKCQELMFQWRGMLGSLNLAPIVVSEATMQVTRLTEHYRTPLLIAKALVEKQRTDIFGSAHSKLPSLEFYLPSLFEKFVYRLVSETLVGSPLRSKEQAYDSEALRDGMGDKYRSIIPDIVIHHSEDITGIIDAKFKPRYVFGAPEKKIPKENRVSNADIYQLFFYQMRMMKLNSKSQAPLTAIVAPLFGRDGATSDPKRREIVWADNFNRESELKVQVLPIPMDAVFSSIARGEKAFETIANAPELKRYLEDILSDVEDREATA
jgi:hypothetical protein